MTERKAASAERTQGQAILESLEAILKRCEETGVRLGYPGEGGERQFRGWLVTDLLLGVLGWPSDKYVGGERFDILLLDFYGSPIVTIETKTPYSKASKKERADFENRLSGYGTLRSAYFTNGLEWERLDISSPKGTLVIRERFDLNLRNTSPEEAEAFFAPLAADRYFGGTPRFSRHSVSKDAPHVLESLAADLDQIISEWAIFLESLHSGFFNGKAGGQTRAIALSLFNLWCDKSLTLSPSQASKRLADRFREGDLSARDIAKAVSELGLPGADVPAIADALARLPKTQCHDPEILTDTLWPAYALTVKKLCAQTAHVLLARALLYRVGEDQEVFPRLLSGEDMERVLAASPSAVLEKPKPAIELLFRVRLSMENFLSTIYKLGEFDWWLVTPEKRAGLKAVECAWLREKDDEFEKVARQLLRILDGYFFGRVDVDVWRNVYQHYLPPGERQKLGGFYTPDELVNLILDLAEFKPEAKGLCKLSFIDAACGSGAFVTSALARLLKHLELDLPCHSELRVRGLPGWKQAEAILNIVAKNLHAVDIHPFASFLTTLNVLFILMSMYVKARQKNPDFSLDLQVFSSDSLEKHDEDLLKPDLFTKLNSRVQLTEESFNRYRNMLRVRFDRVFGNPPWGGVLKGPLAPVYDTAKKERFAREYPSAAKGKYDIYGLFMERALQILKPGGRLGLVTQGTFVDKEWAAGLRTLLASRCRLRYLVDLNPFGQLFFHAMNIPCITVADLQDKVDGKEECVAILSRTPDDFSGLNEVERRKRVDETIRECLKRIPGQRKGATVGFATVARVPHKLLRETAKNRWNLAGSDSGRDMPKGWMTAADLLEMRQGVTPGGCLELFLLASETAVALKLEDALVHRAIKSKEIVRWRVSWTDRVIFYPYHLLTEDDAAPAFTLDLDHVRDKELADSLRRTEVKDALDFDKQIDHREEEITHRKGVNNSTVGALLQHRISLGLVRYPKAASYLVQHYERLEGRVFKQQNIRKFNRRWYEYLWPRDPKLVLTKKRIVSPSLIKQVRFALDNIGYLSDHACLYLQPTAKTNRQFSDLQKQLGDTLGQRASREEVLKYCLAFLNSDYAQERLVTGHLPTPKGFYAVTEDYLKEIPVPPPTEKKATAVTLDLVTNLIRTKSEQEAARLEEDLSKIVNRLLKGDA